ncbi:hypothetical protein N566_07940 [Streptomycetaceae bacterium MP113-05]|nr:hypothetical protein N566_07940 [Streptomycetaceae bacterium MP113-05]
MDREMRRQCDTVLRLSRIDRLPDPVSSPELFGALCEGMSAQRGRPVRFRLVPFPAGTASGLWLATDERDLVVVEECTDPDHQLLILAHEFGHMVRGHSGHRFDGAAVAARLPPGAADLRDTIATVAARTHLGEQEEREAEAFGLLLSTRCRAALRTRGGRRDVVGGRIGMSLGYRGRPG